MDEEKVVKEREFVFEESLVLNLLNYLATNPAVQLFNQIQMELKKQAVPPGKEGE